MFLRDTLLVQKPALDTTRDCALFAGLRFAGSSTGAAQGLGSSNSGVQRNPALIVKHKVRYGTIRESKNQRPYHEPAFNKL